ncbi:putative UPF0392 protein-like [Iris pallida]|uniref:Glycosyltransferase family 92 protein n=1 Tax=Iris pallida TaxID=29817 RepID=A0AAX6H852_IRIPA|nr:putative UPF0392 protein-like [Iris pallida]
MGRRKMKSSHVFSFVVGSLLVFSFFLLHVNHSLFFPSSADAADDAAADNIDTNKFSSIHRHTLTNSVIREHQHAAASPPRPPSSSSVLLPDWEVLVISPAADRNDDGGGDSNLSCVFRNGATSAARYAGTVPSSGRATFLCTLPNSVRRLRPFHTPRVVSKVPSRADAPPATSSPMARWNRLAYESLSTADDVIVFAKGVNRHSVSRPASELRCVFVDAEGAAIAETAVTSSAQEVFRCAHPDIATPPPPSDVRVSIRVVGEGGSAIPTAAAYKPAGRGTASKQKARLCASTMVYNAAKFLPEWMKYHSSVGVDKFVLYDNGSEDDLESAAARLREAGGYDVDVVYWPWPKTQEAGFSHAAAAYRDACDWMAFLDVDEFVFSPAWSGSDGPDRAMLGSMLPTNRTRIGQVCIRCLEFGPSGQRTHPRGGVTQGYTCRTRVENRHKSIVRPDAIDESLANSIHHFVLDGSRWETSWVGTRQAVVNHYKFQAWDEFRVKFRRRASSYVSDWTDRSNPGSNDRTPGLGFRPVEPEGWAGRFCEVNDTGLRDVTRRWFGGVEPNAKMVWEE